MTDASYFDARFVRSQDEPDVVPLPEPQPYTAPVFIYDAVTPIAGETLLSLLMKRMAADDQP